MMRLDADFYSPHPKPRWLAMAALAVILAWVLMFCSGCIITSQRVAGRRMAIYPAMTAGGPGVAAVFEGAYPSQWTTGEKIVGGVETAGWVGIAAALYEMHRKANSGTGSQPTVIQHTYSGNNVYIGRDAGTVSSRRDEAGH